jgi:hypothetical protein
MPRAKDLDKVAPDDLIVTPPVSKKTSSKKISKSKAKAQRKKVYQLIKDTTKTSFSSFLARPKVFTFDSRDDKEEIILVLRRHWFSNLSWIFTAVLLFALPVFIPVFAPFGFLSDRFISLLNIFWYLITFAFAFEQFLSWYFNVFIITEERVVDVDFFNLLYKKTSEAKIDMIQDVTVSQIGVAQTLFNYGNVIVQTAAEMPEIELEKVPNPNLVLKVLQQMRTEEEIEKMEGRIK